MLSALFTGTGEQVILLEADGRERAEVLLTLAHRGKLKYEVCEELVIVRAGDVVLPHCYHPEMMLRLPCAPHALEGLWFLLLL